MSTNSPYYFFPSKRSSAILAADNELKSTFGEDGGLIVSPYFPLPPYGEPLSDTDTKTRFPQLQHLVEFLKRLNDVAEEYWVALVSPEEKGRSMEGLTVQMKGELKLVRQLSIFLYPYIGTLVASAVSGLRMGADRTRVLRRAVWRSE